MSEPPRQLLKLKINTTGIKSEESTSTPTPGSGKIKLRIGGGSSTPKVEKAPDTASSAPRKSIIKVSNPKKEPKEEKAAKPNATKKHNNATTKQGNKKAKDARMANKVPTRLKITAKEKPEKVVKLAKQGKQGKQGKTPVTPGLKLVTKGRPPTRPRGQGYDSEASDAEEDPSIEENFILRMIPGEDCDYVRQAIQDRNWGKDGANVRLKFLQQNGRRAVLTVKNTIYAAIFVDMPCIVEGVKSWDKKAWYKVADICQMLMVLGVIRNESEALTYPIPDREVDPKTWSYAHGLTPPMHWVRKRRFRKRTSTHTIEEVENQVQRLLQADEESVGEVRYEIFDPHRPATQSLPPETDQSDMEIDEELDGEGEMDEEEMEYDVEVQADAQEDDANAEDLEAQFESFMAQDEAEGIMEVDEAATPASSAAVLEVQRMESSDVSTPAAGTTSKDETEEDESEDDDEEEVDEEELEQRADLQRQREEITDLESAIKDQIAELGRVQSNMLKNKIQNKIQSLKADLELKKSAIGEGEED